ncbi:hypothetical protein PEDI_14980 [Persicobacter diffluens]|uniref:Uncharacterized protein n=1 Tax=Persicobacter diffluens TaxID=981 RepID=A0AAN4VXN6_9BACT|nr:hypothetical protein PEDI_14980 [Persicobacter diffluens]
MVLVWGIFYFSCNAQGRFPDPGFSPINYRQQRIECQDYYKVDVSLKTLWKVGGIDVLDIELETRGPTGECHDRCKSGGFVRLYGM